jgi:ethanolamine utilization protein EutA
MHDGEHHYSHGHRHTPYHSHDHGHDHFHDHDEEFDADLENNALWLMDHIELKSIGVDIGSAGTQVIFSRLKLKRMGEDLASRYVVVSRESIYRSPIFLTPYVDEKKIDDQEIGRIIDESCAQAGMSPADIDTGAVILTGEAIRRENARALADRIAEKVGNFVCAAAGHHMEALLAAYGSGAAKRSYDEQKRILNIDIGGGTTKLAVVENGRVVETAALYIGGRLIVFDGNRRVLRLEPGGKTIARRVGLNLHKGDFLSEADVRSMTEWMADAVITAVTDPRPPREISDLFLTSPFSAPDDIDGVMFSGGVGEYVYRLETKEFGDLGKCLGEALHRRVTRDRFPWPLLAAGERIRATVVGASEHSVQVSGNTIYISDERMLPVKNLQVLHPPCDLSGGIDEHQLACAIRRHFSSFDLAEGEADVALAFEWRGDPDYERILAFVKGIEGGMANTIKQGKPIVIVLDGDIARTVGTIMKEERKIENDILSIDGIFLQDFDFIDIGKILYPSGTVPVTIKSLVFQM